MTFWNQLLSNLFLSRNQKFSIDGVGFSMYNIMVNFEQCGVTLCHPTEAYRSGHNGPDSKSGSPHGLVGSNPTASATKALKTQRFQGLFLFPYGALFYDFLLKWRPDL